MNIEVLTDPASVAERAACFIADEARAAVAARGKFVIALSGGHTPWLMLSRLASASVPWRAIEIMQVDERVAPDGHDARNLTHIRETLLDRTSLRPQQIHAMPVESADLLAGAARYVDVLRRVAGTPPVLDLVHLGLGPDGHTASLTPGDPALDVDEADVTSTGPYQGRRRMTLTYPILNRARRVLWIVTGFDKTEMVTRLLSHDEGIPAGRIRRDRSLLLADEAALGQTMAKTRNGG